MAWDRRPSPCIWVPNSVTYIVARARVPSFLICMFAGRSQGIGCCGKIMFGLGWNWLELTLRVLYHDTVGEARKKVMRTLRYRIGSMVALLLPALTLPTLTSMVWDGPHPRPSGCRILYHPHRCGSWRLQFPGLSVCLTKAGYWMLWNHYICARMDGIRTYIEGFLIPSIRR